FIITGFDSLYHSFHGYGITYGSSHASPETLQRDKCDQRSDIYSTGLVLYRMLTQDSVQVHDAEFDIADLTNNEHQQHYEDQVERMVEAIEAGDNEWIVPIIRCCLSYNPDHRYQNAGDLLIDFWNLQPYEPTADDIETKRMLSKLRKKSPTAHRRITEEMNPKYVAILERIK
ncbi:hypothetical protein ACFL0V_04375, partial [Nanoarchaeota archaeon]